MNDMSTPVIARLRQKIKLHSAWYAYLLSLGLVASISVVGIATHGFLHPTNSVMLYLAGVVVAAIYLGRGPSMLASFISVLAFDFFLVDPRLTFSVADTEYLLSFFGLLVVGVVISNLTSTVREQMEDARRREAQAQALNALSHDLTIALDLDDMLQAVVRHVSRTFNGETVVFLPKDNQLLPRAATQGFVVSEQEYEAALWAFRQIQPCGYGSAQFAAVGLRCLPLETFSGVMGVLGVRPAGNWDSLNLPQQLLLDSFASLAALAIERARLAEQANQAHILRAAEKLQTTLLNSISHDLRTPLASITGALSSLRGELAGADPQARLPDQARSELLDNAWEEAGRLNRLVGNLLDMTRIETGNLHLNLSECDLQDLTGAALAQAKSRLHGRPVAADIPNDLPPVHTNATWMAQALVNLLDNAAKYSPAGSEITISARRREDRVEIRVLDRGVGVPPGDLDKIFDKFYRVQNRTGASAREVVGRGASGAGLGLAICRGIVEAHDGRIHAENRPGGGLAVVISLPAAPSIE